MINLSLHINKVFREQVEFFLNATFNENTMENIRDVMKKKNTCVIAQINFYENKGAKPKKVYMVLSFVLCFMIENYVYIDYTLCQ